jgi:hypothetical protein
LEPEEAKPQGRVQDMQLRAIHVHVLQALRRIPSPVPRVFIGSLAKKRRKFVEPLSTTQALRAYRYNKSPFSRCPLGITTPANARGASSRRPPSSPSHASRGGTLHASPPLPVSAGRPLLAGGTGGVSRAPRLPATAARSTAQHGNARSGDVAQDGVALSVPGEADAAQRQTHRLRGSAVPQRQWDISDYNADIEQVTFQIFLFQI